MTRSVLLLVATFAVPVAAEDLRTTVSLMARIGSSSSPAIPTGTESPSFESEQGAPGLDRAPAEGFRRWSRHKDGSGYGSPDKWLAIESPGG
jgi:hypothetical protein